MRIRTTAAELEAALRGRVTVHHPFLLQLHLDHLDAVDAAACHMRKDGTLYQDLGPNHFDNRARGKHVL